MRREELTQSKLKELLQYNPGTGIFTWKVKPSGIINAGDVAGHIYTSRQKQYMAIQIKRIKYAVHRLAWLYVHGDFPTDTVDHINGDGTDNRIENLRVVSLAENQKNKRRYKNSTSGTTGVNWFAPSRKWRAIIQANGMRKHLGYFEDINDAINARKQAEKEYGFHENHGSF